MLNRRTSSWRKRSRTRPHREGLIVFGRDLMLFEVRALGDTCVFSRDVMMSRSRRAQYDVSCLTDSSCHGVRWLHIPVDNCPHIPHGCHQWTHQRVLDHNPVHVLELDLVPLDMWTEIGCSGAESRWNWIEVSDSCGTFSCRRPTVKLTVIYCSWGVEDLNWSTTWHRKFIGISFWPQKSKVKITRNIIELFYVLIWYFKRSQLFSGVTRGRTGRRTARVTPSRRWHPDKSLKYFSRWLDL